VLAHPLVVDSIVENNAVKGVAIENKSGRQAILADVVIDSTGDADIAARAGAPIDKLPKSGYLMAMIMLFRVGGIDYKKIADYARQHPEDFTPGNGVPPGDSRAAPFSKLFRCFSQIYLISLRKFFSLLRGACSEKGRYIPKGIWD
jgi:hypothetical protein